MGQRRTQNEKSENIWKWKIIKHNIMKKINTIKYNIMKACKIPQNPSLEGNL